MKKMNIKHFSLAIVLISLTILCKSSALNITTDCNNNPCLNGGSCILTTNGTSCLCPSGFGGIYCESKGCSGYNPCLNGGMCYDDSTGQTTCICVSGFTGTYCEEPTCSYNPCYNGGSCAINYLNEKTCICPSGWNGTYCETKTKCTDLKCLNRGSCSVNPNNWRSIIVNGIYLYTNEVCTCKSSYTGVQCELKNTWSNYIWDGDEQCRFMYGPGTAYYRSSNVVYDSAANMCDNIYCYSLNGMKYFGYFTPANGTICGAGALCYNRNCVNITNAPKSPFFDQKVEGQTCEEYIGLNSTLGVTFCNTDIGKSLCFNYCKKYLMIKCNDTMTTCQAYANSCSSTIPNTSTLVKTACPLTCRSSTCKLPIKCSSTQNLCLNGGTCQNTASSPGALFAFQCACPIGYSGAMCETYDPCLANPCPSGKTCKRIGIYNKECV